LRVAVVTTEYPPFTPDEGGIGTLYASLVPHLAELGLEVHVFAPSHARDARREHGGVRLHLLEPAGAVAWSVRAARAVRAEGSFDLVWAPEWRGSAWAYSRRRDAGPLVTHLFTSRAMVKELSGGWPRRPAALLGARLQDALERRQTERSDAILAQSESILDWTRRMWDVDGRPVRVLPSVLDVAGTRALADAPLPDDLPEGGPRVVFFGRLEPRKGLDVLVRAMPAVWERFPDARLVIFGNGNDQLAGELQELAGPRADRLDLMGHRTGTDLFPAVRAADVVALPSRWENFALSALETMALGRPVVLTTAGGAPEFATDGVDAMLVPPEDEQALGRAIRGVLESAELSERLGMEAAKTAERYDVAAVAPRYLAYFEDLLAGR
jgi:glycogen(starch) synthase